MGANQSEWTLTSGPAQLGDSSLVFGSWEVQEGQE